MTAVGIAYVVLGVYLLRFLQKEERRSAGCKEARSHAALLPSSA